jgi:hypothetical protein
MTCEDCGQELHNGSWPWCPHGVSRFSAVGDDIPGGMVVENMSHEPFTVYSQTEFKAAMETHNVRLRDCWAGPEDRYLSNWAVISPKTLEDAKALLERVGTAKPSDDARATLETFEFSARPWRES